MDVTANPFLDFLIFSGGVDMKNLINGLIQVAYCMVIPNKDGNAIADA